MSTHSICFHGEIRKIIWIFLSGVMQNALCAGRSGQKLLTLTPFNYKWYELTKVRVDYG